MNTNSSNKCVYCDFNKYIPKPCNSLKNKVILSCSNVLGVDGWPASRPNQSNQPYTNGINRSIPPNGYKRYSYILNLISTTSTNGVQYPPFQSLRIYDPINPLANKDKINSTTKNPIYWIFAKDVRAGDKLSKEGVAVKSNNRIMLFSNNRCCGNNDKCYRTC